MDRDANNSEAASGALLQAFEALQRYDTGSGRADLLPIDEAVAASSAQSAAARRLERKLLETLGVATSDMAREYICSKLALIGSELSVPALVSLLSHPRLALGARTALELIPSLEAAKALRSAVPKLAGLLKIGVINSLGTCRDQSSVKLLVKLLRDPDLETAGAAAAALGRIGSSKAGRALRAWLPLAPSSLRSKAADAALVCAEHAAEGGQVGEALALYRVVLNIPGQPQHIQTAAACGLRSCQARG